MSSWAASCRAGSRMSAPPPTSASVTTTLPACSRPTAFAAGSNRGSARTCRCNLAVENDAVTNTTVTGGISFHWGGVSRAARQADPLAAKLGDRVVRDPAIIMRQKSDTTREFAIDPVTGLPIEVRHVDSNAAPGGDGSVLHPYQTLAQLQAGSSSEPDPVRPADSVFIDQKIKLQPNQALLGEGIDHYFAAVQGTFLLPRATTGTNLPLIQDTFFGPFVSSSWPTATRSPACASTRRSASASSAATSPA